MNKLKYAGFAEETQVKVINGLGCEMKIYKGNILTFSFINENKWKVGVFGCYSQLKKI
jgi:hypothetical protein